MQAKHIFKKNGRTTHTGSLTFAPDYRKFGISESGYSYLISTTKQKDNNRMFSKTHRNMLIEGINAQNAIHVSLANESRVIMSPNCNVKKSPELFCRMYNDYLFNELLFCILGLLNMRE